MSLEWDDEGTGPELAGVIDGEFVVDAKDLAKRVRADDKRIINGQTDVNQLVPFKYKWAWDKYLKACENQWMPTEVSMERDAEQWNELNALNNSDRDTIIKNLGFYITSETINATSNVVLGIYRNITAAECRQYLLRQAFEEALRSHSFQYTAIALGINTTEITEAHQANVALNAKNALLQPYIDILSDPTFATGIFENDQKILKAIIVFYCLIEGFFFYVDFTQVIALGRQGKMVGVAEQFKYMLRDQVGHNSFGVDLINAYKTENPELWTSDFRAEIQALFAQAVELEYAYVEPKAGEERQYKQYLRFLANQRAAQIGLQSVFTREVNPFPWMNPMLGLQRDEKAFESRAPERSTGVSLSFD
jgi:ribonucleoside-diphosphate reductase beta chain